MKNNEYEMQTERSNTFSAANSFVVGASVMFLLFDLINLMKYDRDREFDRVPNIAISILNTVVIIIAVLLSDEGSDIFSRSGSINFSLVHPEY